MNPVTPLVFLPLNVLHQLLPYFSVKPNFACLPAGDGGCNRVKAIAGFSFFLFFFSSIGHSGLDEEFQRLLVTRYQAPEFLSYDELVMLSSNPNPGGDLEKKVEKLLNTPIVSNEAYFMSARPKKPKDPRLGPFLRVVQWNIEKSMKIEEAIWAFKDENAFKKLIDTERFKEGSKEYQAVLAERRLLEEADIIILQEMDIGMKRSEYRNAVRDLAEALDMNYVYGTEYLEIDPVNLGIEKFVDEKGVEDKELQRLFAVDPAKYKGLFGSAILSRYPILEVKFFQLKNQAYDWYHGEQISLSALEKARRRGARAVFLETLFREMKVGGRVFLQADLYVPDLPEKRLSVVNVHLEIKCKPKGREIQMAETLSHIIDIKNPVILAGDFNSAPGDLSPTSVRRELRNSAANQTFWFDQAVRYATPQGLVLTGFRFFSNITKNFQNPTARHIPIVAPNPTKGLFKLIENFRFYDTFTFDFRGDPRRSVHGEKGPLANSNQRDSVGYKMTFTTERTIAKVLGKYRLDWIFVKSYLWDPKDRKGPYRFSPHFGRTLEEMNDRLKERISDHHPNVVDLPFEEPNL